MSADQSARQTSIRRVGEFLTKGTGDAELRRRVRQLVDELLRGMIHAILSAQAAELGDLVRGFESGRYRPRASSAVRATPVASEARGPSAKARSNAKPSGRGKVPAKGRDAFERGRAPRERAERAERADEGHDGRSATAPHDPFDITSPSELLESTGGPASTSRAEVALEISSAADGTAAATADGGAAAAGVFHGSNAVDLPSAPRKSAREGSASRAKSRPPKPSGGFLDAETSAESERRPRIVLREGERLLSATGSGVVIRRARVHNGT
jgi:hypothetical protein